MGETRKRKTTMAQTTETNDDTHTQHNNGWPTPHATTHTTIRQENKPWTTLKLNNSKPRPTSTPQKWHQRHAPKTTKLQRPRSNHRDPWALNTTPSPHLHHHHKFDSGKHKVIKVKGRERRTKRWRKQNSLTQINFWTNQPMEKSHDNKKFEQAPRDKSKFPNIGQSMTKF